MYRWARTALGPNTFGPPVLVRGLTFPDTQLVVPPLTTNCHLRSPLGNLSAPSPLADGIFVFFPPESLKHSAPVVFQTGRRLVALP